MSAIFENIGIDPGIIIIILLIIVIILIGSMISYSLRLSRLERKYKMFMKGSDAQSLEKTFMRKFAQIDRLYEAKENHEQTIKSIVKNFRVIFSKYGVEKYDAFDDVGGKLSFALALLDKENTGLILNAVHSRDNCFLYLKEIVKGESYVMLSQEEVEADIKFVRENPEIVKQNIRNKFQDSKLELVDKVLELDKENRAIKQEVEALRAERNKISKQIGALMGQGKREEAEEIKKQVAASGARIDELSAREKEVEEELLKDMMVIPNIIDPTVPIGKDDSENVEVEKFGEPVVPDFEIPYHTEIMENFDGIDLDSARRVAGNGFYYLMGDIARLHSAVISYARDFMINRGFTYCVPPFMIRSNVVTGVMSFAEMDAMMYKIEGEDLYLIGTSEHSMIGKFIDQIIPEQELPKTLTSYSPCFRKEKGAHGLEERGVYRIHQFEKQEMIVVCKPEDSKMWFEKLWQNTVDLFRSLDIPVRTLECCSGDLADLKVKSVDVEAWSPRQKKYFEVGSCSNLGDAQARRLKIRVNGEDGKKYLAHTLNNTVVAPPRMLIAFLENNLNADGSVNIPEALQPYMGGMKKIEKKTRA